MSFLLPSKSKSKQTQPVGQSSNNAAAGGAGGWADDLEDDDTKTIADGTDVDDAATLTGDAASIFSFTPTLVNRRTGALAYQHAEPIQPASTPLAGDQLFATFVATYESWTPSAYLFARHGLPARIRRGGNKGLLSKLQKSTTVQFPLRMLDEVGYHPHPQSLKDVAAKRAQHERSRKLLGVGTVWDFESLDLTGMREKELIGLALSVLLKGDDMHNARLIYPQEAVRAAPKGALRKDGSVVASVKWATLRLLSPAPTADPSGVGAAADAPSSSSTQQRNYAPKKETDEELFQRLFEPSAEAESTLDRVLEHLERRGGIWTHAGHFTGHSFRNSDPRTRPEFTVHGLFPSALLQRFKRYRQKDAMPMPSDLKDGDKDGPLIVRSVAERLGDHQPPAEEVDVLEGWSVAANEEPYRTSRGRYNHVGSAGGMLLSTG